jgi:hypothetical protein
MPGDPDVAEAFGAAQPGAFPGEAAGQGAERAGGAGEPVGGAAFSGGWDLVEPGLVQVPLWRPDGKPPGRESWTESGSTEVARKSA